MISKFIHSFLSHVLLRESKNGKGLQLASAILGGAFFTAFFVIAWIYYQERMIPFDGAFYCFKMIDTKSFNIELGRFGVIATQVLPWLSLQLNASLETVLRLYSLNFIVIQFFLFIVIIYGFKDYKSSLALLLALCLGYRYQFYYTVSEIHQTIAPVVLIFTLLNSSLLWTGNNKDRILFMALFIGLCAWLANIHMLSLVLITFVVCYAVLEKKLLLYKKELWISIAGGYAFFAYKLLTIPKGSYDDSKLITIDKLKVTLTQLRDIPSFQFFKADFFSNYYILVFAALILVALYSYRKKWLALSYVVLSLIGFFILIIAYNITPDSPVVYQNYYACFGLMIAIPLAVELVSVFQLKVVVSVVAILLILSTVKILQCGRIYELRMEYFSRMEKNVKGLPESKFMLYNKNISWQMIWMDWNLGFETLMHSSIASPDSAITFTAAGNYSDYDSMMYKPNTFIGVGFSPYWFTSDHLSKDYFRIKNTPYRILNKISKDRFANAKFDSSHLELSFPQQVDTSLPYFLYQMIPVEVYNKSNDTLYSRYTNEGHMTLGYKIYDLNGKLLNTAGCPSEIEADVYPHAKTTTGITINYLKRGTYVIEIDLVYECKDWLNVNTRKTFTIY